MAIYWIFFFTFAVSALVNLDFRKRTKISLQYSANLALILFIGLRYQVGGDWFTYYNDFEKLPPKTKSLLRNKL